MSLIRQFYFCVIIGMLFILPMRAFAESFEDRAQIGHAAEQMPDYKDYIPEMYSKTTLNDINTIAKVCFPKSVTNKFPLPTYKFTLVADIDGAGKMQRVDVKPKISETMCVMKKIVATVFPSPPNYSGRSGFPITIDWTIKFDQTTKNL